MIDYTYNIISVDQAARCMEIVYTSPGRQTLHIGARLPYENETLEAVLRMYAPIALWVEAEQQVQVPPLESGSLSYTPPAPPTPAESVYTMRGALLQQSDWTQLIDVPLTDEQRAAWVTYRQELRDVPNQPGFPEQIIWPVAPSYSVTDGIPVAQP